MQLEITQSTTFTCIKRKIYFQKGNFISDNGKVVQI